MKQKLLLGLLALMVNWVAMAQDRQISGKVTDAADGTPLPGVNVRVKGTTKGTTTDANGAYKISADGKATLVFSSVGYGNVEQRVGSGAEINTQMIAGGQLEEVTVTALGITREKRELAFTSREIKAKDLMSAPDPNAVRNLAGQIPGLVLNNNGGSPGSSSRLVIRGERYITGGNVNGPLIVIDGVISDNTVQGQPGEFNGADTGDALANINPDDIESISVLSGPNAAALYGTQAANGAVIVTTKKGVVGKATVTYGLNYASETPTYNIAFQNRFAQGDNGAFNAGSDNSWGPAITGQSVTYNGKSYNAAAQDHVGAFLQTGSTMTHNLSVAAGNEKTTVRFSLARTNQDGIVPTNALNRTSMNLRLSSDISKRLSLDTKLTYTYQIINNRPPGGEESSNAYSSALRMPTTYPLDELRNYEIQVNGAPRQNFYVQNAIIGNPYWVVNRQLLEEVRHRVQGMAAATFKITDNLSLMGRGSIDTYFDNTERKLFAGTPTALTNTSAAGDYTAGNNRVTVFTADFLARYRAKITEQIGIYATAGGSIENGRGINSFISSGGLDYANLFTFNNGLRRNGGQGITGGFPYERQGLYGSVQLSYKDALFLEATLRNDWSSTLPAGFNSYLYPSVAANAILSDLVAMPDIISFAKVRASYARGGRDAQPLQTIQYLNAGAGVVGTILTNSSVKVIGESLRPFFNDAIEAGLELKFLQNRIGLDFTYYKSNTINQIFNVPLRPSSGFTSEVVNGGDIQNSGIEIVLSGKIIKKKDFDWNSSLNFAQNTNKVVSLRQGLENYGISSTRISTTSAKVGDRLGEIFVLGFQRDAQGRVLVNQANGLPVLTNGRTVYVGNINPDFMMGWNNTIRYKDFSFNFLFDWRQGGVSVSHTQAVLHGLGKVEATATGRNNDFVVPGVAATQINGQWISDGQANARAIQAEVYWKQMGGRGTPVGELFAYDASNIRLRSASLNYSLPKSLLGKSFIKAANIGVYGRNLFFLSKNAPFDPEVGLSTGVAGQGVDFYSVPSTRSMGFNLNVTF
jgi:TonB-linked SusC/RagA family outer membrane protein